MAGRIVVGVDGSPSSQAALRWAVEEAELRAATVEAVHVWAYIPAPALGEPGLLTLPAVSGDLGQLELVREAAEAELESALVDAFPGGRPATLEPKLVEGDAAQVLEAQSEGAELLVVGHRGRSALASVLLGSVAKHSVDHARCPVVVVQGPRED
jgi:nucleotide-binding universal stress UspA family protein